MAPFVAHIAGVGSSAISRNEPIEDLAVAAGAKALLDAGVTYSSVDQSIACFLDGRERIPRKCFDVFGMEGGPVSEVDNACGLSIAVQFIQSGQSNCVLVIGLDKEISTAGSRKTQSAAIALVLVSQLFLTSHAYLKDSSIRVRACNRTSRFYSRSANGANDARTTKTAVQLALRHAGLEASDLQTVEVRSGASMHLREALGNKDVVQPPEPWSSSNVVGPSTGWRALVRLVYQLRGWDTATSTPKARNVLQYTTSTDGTASVVVLCRSDGQPAPAWSDIKNVRDGRERMGYNPAVEARAITQEDVEAIRAKVEFTSDADLARLRLPMKGGDRAALARL